MNNHFLALVFLYARRFDEALAQAHRMLELNPTYFAAYWDLGMALAATGSHDEAATAIEQALAHAPGDPTMAASLAWVHAHGGRREEAARILEQLKHRTDERYFSGLWLGVVNAELEDPNQAVSWLERAYGERDGLLVTANVMFLLDPLRADPRFQALLQKMNFPAATTD